MSEPLTQWRVYGRDKYGDEIDGPWWPLFHHDGPVEAESAEAALAHVRGRLSREPQWVELAAVPFEAWITMPAASPDSGTAE